MISRKLPAIGAALALLAFASVLFYPALFEGRLTAPLDIATRLLAPWKSGAEGAKPWNHYTSDAVTQYLPYRVFAEKSLREDGYIGWNPYEMGGYSLAANTMALPGSWALQLHALLPFKEAWNFGIIAEFLIAGAGMLVFLRSRNLPWLPTLVGAAAFMFNSQFIIWIYHRWALGSFCWMPWVLWGSGADFGKWPPSTRHLLLPVFLALAMLGGSLQHIAFVVIACGCIFAGGILRLRDGRAVRASFLSWLCAASLASGMAAFSLYPQISGYFSNLANGHTRGAIGYELGVTQPLVQSLLIPMQVWPWLLGDPQTLDGARLFKCGFMDIAFLGTIPMLLALAGLFHKTMPRQAKWLVAAGLLIPLTPLVGPLYHRVQLLYLLGGAWMAAEMLASLQKNPPQRLLRHLPKAVAALGLVLLLGTLVPASMRQSLENQVIRKSLAAVANSSFNPDKSWIETRAHGWTDRFSIIHPRTAALYGLLVIGTAGLCWSQKAGNLRLTGGRAMVLAATSLELLMFFRTWTTFSDPAEFRAPHPSISEVASLAGKNRVLQRSPGAGFTEMLATPNLLSAYYIRSVDAYESIQYPSSLTRLAGLPEGQDLSLAGVGISVYPAGSVPPAGTLSWPVVRQTAGFEIRENPDVPPPLLAGDGPIPETPSGILEATHRSRPVEPTLATMNRWQFQVPGNSAWIRISQNWHEGWKWREPGKDWQPFVNGVDSACWINHSLSDKEPIEVRFFPHPAWTVWLAAVMLAVLAIVTGLASLKPGHLETSKPTF